MIVNIFIYNTKTNIKKSINCDTNWTGKKLKEHIKSEYNYDVKEINFHDSSVLDDTKLSDLFEKYRPVAIYWQ